MAPPRRIDNDAYPMEAPQSKTMAFDQEFRAIGASKFAGMTISKARRNPSNPEHIVNIPKISRRPMRQRSPAGTDIR
jgi:hypothetical protein